MRFFYKILCILFIQLLGSVEELYRSLKVGYFFLLTRTHQRQLLSFLDSLLDIGDLQHTDHLNKRVFQTIIAIISFECSIMSAIPGASPNCISPEQQINQELQAHLGPYAD